MATEQKLQKVLGFHLQRRGQGTYSLYIAVHGLVHGKQAWTVGRITSFGKASSLQMRTFLWRRCGTVARSELKLGY